MRNDATDSLVTFQARRRPCRIPPLLTQCAHERQFWDIPARQRFFHVHGPLHEVDYRNELSGFGVRNVCERRYLSRGWPRLQAREFLKHCRTNEFEIGTFDHTEAGSGLSGHGERVYAVHLQ